MVEGLIPAHYVSEADRPQLGIYHPSFKAAERSVSKICDEFNGKYEALKKQGYYNKEIENILVSIMARSVPKLHYPPVAPVACLGASGVGKSTSINSILGQQDMAPKVRASEPFVLTLD